ncbi:hypothetical protein DL98DRAFT_104135 [Cadophora sp. DSE1049]|nr:hypothetical protein DL98DRAFT_104135 [Cadophora sp. DSE1049]
MSSESKDCLFEASQRSGIMMDSIKPPPNPTNTLPFPQEIRDMIWYEVLAPTGQVSLQAGIRTRNRLRVEACCSNGQLLPLQYSTICLSLLRTSKQVYEETKNIFWPKNRIAICLNNNLALEKCMSSMPVRFLDHLTDVQVFFSSSHTQCFGSFRKVLAKCNRLQSITFTCGTPVREGFIHDNAWHLPGVDRVPGLRGGAGLVRLPNIILGSPQFAVDLMLTADVLERKGVTKRRLVFNGPEMQYHIIESMLMTLHVIFGGELWVNGAMRGGGEAVEDEVQ